MLEVCLFATDLLVASCEDDESLSLDEDEPEPEPLLEELLLELPEDDAEEDSEVLLP